MITYKEYLAYIRDNPNGYWFKRKIYGWGWTPANKKGWAVIGIYTALAVLLAVTQTTNMFVVPFILLTVLLIVVCYKTGEKPKWMWGKENKS